MEPLIRPKLVQAEEVLHKFASIHEFAEHQKTATRDEWTHELCDIQDFNKAEDVFAAYVIKVPGTCDLADQFVFRVKMDPPRNNSRAKARGDQRAGDQNTRANRARLLPAVGQTCKIRIVCGKEHSGWHIAENSLATLSLKAPWANCAEFNVSALASAASEGWDLDEEISETRRIAD